MMYESNDNTLLMVNKTQHIQILPGNSCASIWLEVYWLVVVIQHSILLDHFQTAFSQLYYSVSYLPCNKYVTLSL